MANFPCPADSCHPLIPGIDTNTLFCYLPVMNYEIGPIRPPSEAHSLLLRLNRNCPWNRCLFCPVYKGTKFSIRTAEEVKGDIDTIAAVAGEIEAAGGLQRVHSSAVYELGVRTGLEPGHIHQILLWMGGGMRYLFLQDADALVLKTGAVADILEYARLRFPGLDRVTCYARALTLNRKTSHDMKALARAGLTRIHTGLESGSDKVLAFVRKGVTAAGQIEAGKKVVQAGIELSEYFMPGLGGLALSRENALESARVLNAIRPHIIRLRSTTPYPGTELYNLFTNGAWQPLGHEDTVREIRLFVENLEGPVILYSDHVMNLLEDAGGRLPEDKARILAVLDGFLALPPEQKESFILGKRLGYFRRPSEMRHDPGLEAQKTELKNRYGSVDKAVWIMGLLHY